MTARWFTRLFKSCMPNMEDNVGIERKKIFFFFDKGIERKKIEKKGLIV